MIVIDCQQGTPEWWQAKLGVPSASEFDRIMTPPDYRDKWDCGNPECTHIAENAALKCKKGKGTAIKYVDVGMTQSASADSYMDKLLGEYFSGKPDETFQSEYMKLGNEKEQEARDYYAFQFNCEPRKVGFCLHDSRRYGCSPDMLLDGGGAELKCVIKGTLIKYHRKGVLPIEYRLQVLGSLAVSEFDYWGFMAYHEDLKPFHIMTYRKDVLKELTALSDAVNRFCDKLDKERELLRSKFQ